MIGGWLIVPILGVLFIATVVRAALGFGEALIAVPLLALFLPVEVAAPVAVLTSITVAAVLLLRDRAEVHVRSAGWLVVSSLVGIPVGLWFLTALAEPVVKTVLAVVIVSFSAYSLLNRRTLALNDDRSAWLFGFSAGVLGGAYGMNGPPLAIYGGLRGWSPRQFRATLQGYFLPASTMVMVGYAFAGLWTREVTRYYVIALPVIVLGIVVGGAVHDRFRKAGFLLYVHVVLLLVGVTLLMQALQGG